MDDRAQLSTEYLIILAVALVLAAMVGIVAFNLFSLKDSIADNISIYSSRALQMMS